MSRMYKVVGDDGYKNERIKMFSKLKEIQIQKLRAQFVINNFRTTNLSSDQ